VHAQATTSRTIYIKSSNFRCFEWLVRHCSEVLDSILTVLFLPERQVLLQQLDDGLGISKGFLINVINFLEGLRESLLTKGASLLMVVHDLVVEDRVVESETESDWVAWIKALGKLIGLLVAFEGSLLDSLELVLRCGLSNVSVVVSDHLLEEGLRLVLSGKLDALALYCRHNLDAFVVQLLLDLLLVGAERFTELLVFWILFDGTDGTDGTSLGSNEVLEAN